MLWHKYRRIRQFVVIGGSLYVLSWVLLEIFVGRLGMHEESGFALQTVITYTLQFVLNALYTWRDRGVEAGQTLLRIAKYIPAKVVLWGVTQAVFALWLTLTGAEAYQLANAFTVGTMMLINYILFDIVVFTMKRS